MNYKHPGSGKDSIMFFDADLSNEAELGFMQEVWTYYRRKKWVFAFPSSSLHGDNKNIKISNYVILVYQGQEVSYIQNFFETISSLNPEAVTIIASKESQCADLLHVDLGADSLLLIFDETEPEKPYPAQFRGIIGNAGEDEALFAEQVAFAEFAAAMKDYQLPAPDPKDGVLAQAGFRYPVVDKCYTPFQLMAIDLHFANIAMLSQARMDSYWPHSEVCDECARKLGQLNSVSSAGSAMLAHTSTVYDSDDLGDLVGGWQIYDYRNLKLIMG